MAVLLYANMYLTVYVMGKYNKTTIWNFFIFKINWVMNKQYAL